MTVLVGVLIALGGLAAGTVSAWIAHSYVEEPTEEVAVWTPARCGTCDHTISATDVAPPLWWIRHRARCPHCGATMPRSWLAVQLLVPVGMLAMLATFGTRLVLIPYLWLVPVLVTAATTDILLMLIPKRIAWIGAGVGAALIGIVSVVEDVPDAFVHALIGGVGYITFLFVVSIISPGGMGMGDVRLALVLGLYLGWIDLMLPIVGLLIACVAGIVMGLGFRIATKGAQRHFPFGPGLALGTIITIVWFEPILRALQP